MFTNPNLLPGSPAPSSSMSQNQPGGNFSWGTSTPTTAHGAPSNITTPQRFPTSAQLVPIGSDLHATPQGASNIYGYMQTTLSLKVLHRADGQI